MALDTFKNIDLTIEHANRDNFIPRQFSSEGDISGRTLTVQITENGVPANITGAILSAVWTNKTSGISDITEFQAVDSANGIFMLTYPSHMMTRGTVEMAIQILYKGQNTVTRKFDITVQGVNGNFKAIIEAQQFNYLTQMMARVSEMEERYSSIGDGSIQGVVATKAELSTVYPNGVSGIAVVSGENAWYYYKNGTWVYGNKFVDGNAMQNVQNFRNFIKNGWLESDDLSSFLSSSGTTLTKSKFLARNWLLVKGTNTNDYQGVRIALDPAIFDFGFGRWYNFSATIQNDLNTKIETYVKYFYSDGTYGYNQLIDSFTPPKNNAMTYERKIFLAYPDNSKTLQRVELLFLQRATQSMQFNIADMTLNTLFPNISINGTQTLFNSQVTKYMLSDYRQTVYDTKNAIQVKSDGSNNAGIFLQSYPSKMEYSQGTYDISVNLMTNKPLKIQFIANLWQNGEVKATKFIDGVTTAQNRMSTFNLPVIFASNTSQYDRIEFGIISTEKKAFDMTVTKFDVEKSYQKLRDANLIQKSDLKHATANFLGQGADIQLYSWNGTQVLKYISKDLTTSNQGVRWFFDASNGLSNAALALNITLQNIKLKNTLRVILQGYDSNNNVLFTNEIYSYIAAYTTPSKVRRTLNVPRNDALRYCAVMITSSTVEDIEFTISDLSLSPVFPLISSDNAEETALALDHRNYIKNGSLILDELNQFWASNSTLSFARFSNRKWINVSGNGIYAGLRTIIYTKDLSFATKRNYRLNFVVQADEDTTFMLVIKHYDATNKLLETFDIDAFNVFANQPISVENDIYLNEVENTNYYSIELLYTEDVKKAFNVSELSLRQKDFIKKANETNFRSGAVKLYPERKIERDFVRVVGNSTEDYQGVRVTLPLQKAKELATRTIQMSTLAMSEESCELLMYLKYLKSDGTYSINQLINKVQLNTQKYTPIKENYYLPQVESDIKRIEILFTKRSGTTTNFLLETVDFDLKLSGGTDNESSLAQKLQNESLHAINLDITASELADGEKHQSIMNFVDGNGVMQTVYVDVSLQGDSSSLEFALKKSFRLRAYTDETYSKKKKIQWVTGAKPTSDINVKAYFVDWTGAQNLAISDEIRKMTLINSQGLATEQVMNATQEQVVGYPCSVFIKGEYYGIFGMSTKKKDAINADDKKANQYAIQGSQYSEATAFRTNTATFDPDIDFSVEVPDEVTPELKQSFESLMTLVNSGSDTEFKANIASRVNLASFANTFVALMIFGVGDAWGKNTIFETLDGTKYNIVSYDHDLAWGNTWQGTEYKDNMTSTTTASVMSQHKLVQRLFETGLIQEEVATRYKNYVAQRSLVDILDVFETYWKTIGADNYEKNKLRWPTAPSYEDWNFADIKKNIINRWNFVAEELKLENLNKLKK
ncbi:MAG: CotH kinase family protein [Leuconostoc sp.]|nr:CotH kinase family protein [Leuconostoc sp.]